MPGLSMNNSGFPSVRSPQTGKVPIVVVGVELSTLDVSAAGLNDPADVAGLGEQLTRDMDYSVA